DGAQLHDRAHRLGHVRDGATAVAALDVGSHRDVDRLDDAPDGLDHLVAPQPVAIAAYEGPRDARAGGPDRRRAGQLDHACARRDQWPVLVQPPKARDPFFLCQGVLPECSRSSVARSWCSNHCLRQSPPPYPVREPSAPTTRWQGITMAMRLSPLARATARTA